MGDPDVIFETMWSLSEDLHKNRTIKKDVISIEIG
jgi:hypothetical protein